MDDSFVVLTLISLYQLFVSPPPKREGGNIGLALLSVPLYAYMALITGIVFTFFMDYPMGQRDLPWFYWLSSQVSS